MVISSATHIQRPNRVKKNVKQIKMSVQESNVDKLHKQQAKRKLKFVRQELHERTGYDFQCLRVFATVGFHEKQIAKVQDITVNFNIHARLISRLCLSSPHAFY